MIRWGQQVSCVREGVRSQQAYLKMLQMRQSLRIQLPHIHWVEDLHVAAQDGQPIYVLCLIQQSGYPRVPVQHILHTLSSRLGYP